jgi:cytochrome c oxidase cbb3-type subunit I
MTTVHSNVPSRRSSPYSTGGIAEAEIDQSTRVPVMFFVGTALLWLLISTLLGLITSLKVHWPQFLDGIEWLTYGRVRGAFMTAFLYGWASSAAFAVGLWLMARLSQNRLIFGPLLLLAGTFWNIGVIAGVGGVLLGESTGFLALEMPAFAGPLLLVAYAFVGAWCVFTFYGRQYQTTYAAQWYLLAAFFWFPWVFSIAQVMLVFAPVRGTVQSVVNAWYAANFFLLWLTPIALAAIYYFLPKILGRPIRYYYLAVIGFWCFAVIAPWAGVARLTSGPVPAWVSSAGIVAMTMMLVPVAIIAINFFSSFGAVAGTRKTTTLAFIRVAAVVFVALFLVGALLAYRTFQEVIQFTHVNTAMWMLGVYAFFSMAVFGTLYFLLPRLFMRGWASPTLTAIHFWCSLVGVLLIVLSLAVGGWIQGVQINNPEVAFVDGVRATLPWLVGATLGWIILLIAHVAFVWNVVALVVSRAVSAESQAILQANPPAMKVRGQTT